MLRVAVVAWIQSLAWELLHSAGAAKKTEETPTPRLLRRVDEACPGALVHYMQSVNIPIGHIKTKAVTTHMLRQKTTTTTKKDLVSKYSPVRRSWGTEFPTS